MSQQPPIFQQKVNSLLLWESKLKTWREAFSVYLFVGGLIFKQNISRYNMLHPQSGVGDTRMVLYHPSSECSDSLSYLAASSGCIVTWQIPAIDYYPEISHLLTHQQQKKLSSVIFNELHTVKPSVTRGTPLLIVILIVIENGKKPWLTYGLYTVKSLRFLDGKAFPFTLSGVSCSNHSPKFSCQLSPKSMLLRGQLFLAATFKAAYLPRHVPTLFTVFGFLYFRFSFLLSH